MFSFGSGYNFTPEKYNFQFLFVLYTILFITRWLHEMATWDNFLVAITEEDPQEPKHTHTHTKLKKPSAVLLLNLPTYTNFNINPIIEKLFQSQLLNLWQFCICDKFNTIHQTSAYANRNTHKKLPPLNARVAVCVTTFLTLDSRYRSYSNLTFANFF